MIQHPTSPKRYETRYTPAMAHFCYADGARIKQQPKPRIRLWLQHGSVSERRNSTMSTTDQPVRSSTSLQMTVAEGILIPRGSAFITPAALAALGCRDDDV